MDWEKIGEETEGAEEKTRESTLNPKLFDVHKSPSCGVSRCWFDVF